MASDRRKQFLFLNQTVSSGPRSQREKELQDADRRAHAARNSKSKRHASHAGGAASSTSRLLKKHARHPGEEVQQDDAPLEKHSKKRSLVVRSRTPEIEQARRDRPYKTDLLTLTPALGQGNHDPFDTVAVSRLPPFVFGILD